MHRIRLLTSGGYNPLPVRLFSELRKFTRHSEDEVRRISSHTQDEATLQAFSLQNDEKLLNSGEGFISKAAFTLNPICSEGCSYQNETILPLLGEVALSAQGVSISQYRKGERPVGQGLVFIYNKYSF